MKYIKEYAAQNNVPIIQDDGLVFMLETIKNNRCCKILEIGTAIGYSTINMALLNPNIEIVSLEIDEERYNEAKKNIERFNLQSQIELKLQDALQYTTNKKFDFIFIDAAKAQYIKFFELFEKNLENGGIIFTDNLDFHGYVASDKQIKSRNLRQLVTKIKKYREYLTERKNFSTQFYSVGDGVSISKKLY